MTYSMSLSWYDMCQHSHRWIEERSKEFNRQSGVFETSAGVLTMWEDKRDLSFQYRVHFNSSAWTGR